jgi:hypothetical protein
MIYQRRADIHKAFKALEDAIEDKEAELKGRMEQAQIPDFVNNFVSNSFQAMGTSVGNVENFVVNGQAMAEGLIAKAQKEVTVNPWGFLGKVALCSLGLGLILGSRFRNSRSRAKK